MTASASDRPAVSDDHPLYSPSGSQDELVARPLANKRGGEDGGLSPKVRGGQAKLEASRKRNNLTFRVRDDLKLRLAARAAEAGRSLSEEIEHMLEISMAFAPVLTELAAFAPMFARWLAGCHSPPTGRDPERPECIRVVGAPRVSSARVPKPGNRVTGNSAHGRNDRG